ncbi:MAG: FHA domain-containing protein [Kiritimatiellia bacterium]
MDSKANNEEQVMDNGIQIEVVNGPGRGTIFTVPGSGFSLGRSTEPDEVSCALMDDVSVSRRHAVGRVEGDRIVLEDWPGCPSKAGLIVGGQRVARVTLAAGETVVLGRTSLAFHPLNAKNRPRQLSPFRRRWLGVFLFLAIVGGVTAAVAGRAKTVSELNPRQEMDQAWSARCSGELEDAVRLLREARQGKEPGEGAAAMERECQRYARLFEGPRRLEEALQLDEARDAWTRVALGMRPEDPLRAWVETGCVARLSRQLAELRP